MAKKASKKIVVVSTGNKREAGSRKVSPTTSRRTASSTAAAPQELIFGRKNYILMAIGAGLIFLGLALMTGGQMPDPNTWDPDIIYSKRITVLAPMTILAGLIVEIVAIFRR